MNIKLLLASAALTAGFSTAGWAASCEDLKTLKLPDTEIKSAESVAAGAFVVAGAAFWAASYPLACPKQH